MPAPADHQRVIRRSRVPPIARLWRAGGPAQGAGAGTGGRRAGALLAPPSKLNLAGCRRRRRARCHRAPVNGSASWLLPPSCAGTGRRRDPVGRRVGVAASPPRDGRRNDGSAAGRRHWRSARVVGPGVQLQPAGERRLGVARCLQLLHDRRGLLRTGGGCAAARARRCTCVLACVSCLGACMWRPTRTTPTCWGGRRTRRSQARRCLGSVAAASPARTSLLATGSAAAAAAAAARCA